MNFQEIYEQNLVNAQDRDIDCGALSNEPVMTTGLITPESTINIQPLFGIEFSLDKEGMSEVISMFQEKWDKLSDSEKKNLVSILTTIYSVTETYLGGHVIDQNRKNAYMQKDDCHLTLSEIKGKQLGACAERAAIGHQLLNLLQLSGAINYDSILTNSRLTEKERNLHSFIILKSRKDPSKAFLFDIENPVDYKEKEDSKPTKGIALYQLTEQELKDFEDSKSISPKSIYEQFGMILLGDRRIYGEGKKDKNDDNDIDY